MKGKKWATNSSFSFCIVALFDKMKLKLVETQKLFEGFKGENSVHFLINWLGETFIPVGRCIYHSTSEGKRSRLKMWEWERQMVIKSMGVDESLKRENTQRKKCWQGRKVKHQHVNDGQRKRNLQRTLREKGRGIREQ